MVDLIQILIDSYNTPWIYLLLAFGYAILAAILLPIPIELILVKPLSDQNFGFLLGTAFAIAAGKTLGAWLVFVLGLNIEGPIRKWSARWRVAAWFVAKAEKLVRRTGYAGLYLLLSVPLMSDTIPIYLYSIFNQEGKALERNLFLIANFTAALNRVAILGAIWFLARPFFPR